MSEYVNHDMQDAPFEDEVSKIDWVQLQEEVLREPEFEFDDFNWGAWDQGAEAPPGDRASARGARVVPSEPPPMEHTPEPTAQNVPTSPSLEGLHVCHVDGCNLKTFNRKADLERHMRKHEGKTDYPCLAVGCKRTGSRAFTRPDKLKAHIIAGHHDEDVFQCNETDCDVQLSRDLFALHVFIHCHIHRIFWSMRYIRKCPIPKCPFWLKTSKGLGLLQAHLLEKHDATGRATFAGLLKQAGYDPGTAEVLCPICPANNRFARHEEFHAHFYQCHFVGPECVNHTDAWCSDACFGRKSIWRLTESTIVPNESRQHRRAILSIWPEFQYAPVWNDIKCQSKQAYSF
ncbi:Nn.00g096670.m01.CDS01 [Neocucurbitaria sp. VM-36]